jgi:hypothetical protein
MKPRKSESAWTFWLSNATTIAAGVEIEKQDFHLTKQPSADSSSWRRRRDMAAQADQRTREKAD